MMSKDLQKRMIFGGLGMAVFLPILFLGGVSFQLFIGLLAILATAELIRMHGLSPNSIEGALAMLATFVLTLPLDQYLSFLPAEGNFTAYTVVVFLLLGSIVFHFGKYNYSDVVFPIASSFYVGIGFHHLIMARADSVGKVLFAVLIVWATDIGAYSVGSRFGRRKLLPAVSPNKTLEGSLGGIVAAMLVSMLFLVVDKQFAAQHNGFYLFLLAGLFSVVSQFGDLVESAIKRHFGVKDSGKFLPGHGGILDRFDSMIFVLPVMHFFGLF